MKAMKRIIAALLVVMTLVPFVLPVSAASYSALRNITASKYCKAFTLSTSGTTIPYTSSNLTTRGTATYGASRTAYIDNATDELYILGVDTTNGKWAKVTYPCGSKRVTAYIALSAITTSNGSQAGTKATGKFNCAKRLGLSTSSSYYVSTGETVYLIATSGNWYQILYPNNTGWRLGWCTKSDYNKYCGGSSASSSYQVPMKAYDKTRTFGYYVANRDRAYHLGVDYCAISGKDQGVYAFASGTVAKTGYNNANGNYVVIRHTISGETVYSFYGHLASYSVSVGANVSAGSKIGTVGKSGNSSNNVTHLHFALCDTLKPGNYFGYSTYFTGNFVTYSGVKYYNPEYVIQYGKLPA